MKSYFNVNELDTLKAINRTQVRCLQILEVTA